MADIRRLAVIGTGELAMRCLSAVAELNEQAPAAAAITTIALYAEPDADSSFVRDADEAVPFGPVTRSPTGAGERLERGRAGLDQVMAALARARADAAWVGLGALARVGGLDGSADSAGLAGLDGSAGLADFAARCERAGITFVGPPSDVIGLLGDPRRLELVAGSVGVRMAAAGRRPRAAARHVEVQVVADGAGAIWAAGVCDRSIRRAGQQVIEESGCTVLDEPAERALFDAAVRLCAAAGYRGAAAVGFLVDPASRQFQLTRVGMRPAGPAVTEMTTGLDLVKLALRVARGEPLPGPAPPARGHAIGARLAAQDPERAFAPAGGRVSALRLPSGSGIRIDTGVAAGDELVPGSDLMVAGVTAWGRDTQEALGRLRRGLGRSTVVIDGGTTNKAFLRNLLGRPEVRAGSYHDQWLDGLVAATGHLPPPHPLALAQAPSRPPTPTRPPSRPASTQPPPAAAPSCLRSSGTGCSYGCAATPTACTSTALAATTTASTPVTACSTSTCGGSGATSGR